MKITKYIVIASTFISCGGQSAPLKLQDFLTEVQEQNFGVQATSKHTEGYRRRGNEGALIYSPLLTAQTSRTIDKRETSLPAFFGSQTRSVNYGVGVSELTPFGLQGNVGFAVNHVSVYGATALTTGTDYYTVSPEVDLSLDLWRNFLGFETRARVEALNAANRAAEHTASYAERQVMYGAEQAFWRLAAARELVKVQTNILQRAEKLLEWATRRVNLQLGERSDLLQARALVEARRVELATAEEEEKAASLAFNQARQREGYEVKEELLLPDINALQRLKAPERSGERPDVLAVQQNAKLAEAQAQLSKEKTKPSLQLFSSYSQNGRDAEFKPADNEAWGTTHPVTTVGVKFSLPLAFGLMYDVYKGANLEQQASDLDYHKKVIDVGIEWRDTLTKFLDAQNRLTLADRIEKTQKEKLDHEQDRLIKGRTTTYQTVLFDQDYASSTGLRVRTQYEVLRTYAALKLFGDNQW